MTIPDQPDVRITWARHGKPPPPPEDRRPIRYPEPLPE